MESTDKKPEEYVKIETAAREREKSENKNKPVNSAGADEGPAAKLSKLAVDDDKEEDGDNVSENKHKPGFLADTDEGPAAKQGKLSVDEDKEASKGKPTKSKDRKPNSPVKLRRFSRIPIFIVDFHNDVLHFIYRCLATRHLPFENNTLLHFDSHPDMVISRDIPARDAFDKEAMLRRLSIENWVMPLCYVGSFNRLIWAKHSWCKQMPEGKYNFKVGSKEDVIHVDCSLDYFVSEGNYCQTSELEQARDIELQVVNMDADDPPDPRQLLSADNCSSYILDIDLDFFSTTNPFLDIYKNADCYNKLIDIFSYENNSEDSVAEITEKRAQQLDALEDIFEHLEREGTFAGLERPSTDIVSDEVFEKIEQLVESVQNFYPDDNIDWLLLYDAGCTTDNNGLPHHVSSDEELCTYYDQFRHFVKNLPHPPVAITMACSAEDEYCPNNQASLIQDNVMNILREVFKEKVHQRGILYYKGEAWDVMKL